MPDSPAIHTDHLAKAFGRGRQAVQAVKDVSLNVQPGQVYGFLGPNGAGKTTTIRMLMGLIRPTRGEALIFGLPVQNPRALDRVGALVERPAFYSYLSARDNLDVLARTAGNHRSERIAALLEQVGLAEKAHRKVGSYSLGMKQRLGIAAALLGNPDLVILDEPTNGLDPAGIQEMRRFIRSLAEEQGKTVFLSSHLLNEVEQVCDRVAIIHLGALIREGAVRDLLAEGQGELRVQATPLAQAAEALQSRWTVTPDGEWLSIAARPEASPEIVKCLVEQGVSVHQVIIQRQSLEDYFMTVTGNENSAEASHA